MNNKIKESDRTMKEMALLAFVSVLLLSAALLPTVTLVESAAFSYTTTVYIYPPMCVRLPAETFTVDVKIANVRGLWAYEFKLKWEPDLLDVTSVTEGPFLNAEGTYNTFFVPKIWNEPDPMGLSGYIYIACTLMGEPRTAEASGNGTLATVEFRVLKTGNCTLDLYDTMLLDYDLLDMPHTTEDGYYSSVPDITPPTTLDDYDGLWHTTDFTINLTATDDLIGVAETYYEINYGPTKNVSVNGQPVITTESANNTLEYWSVDKAGNEEIPHKILTGIKMDKTAPTGSIAINNDIAYANSTLVTLTLTATDATSGVYQVRFSNDDVWDTEPWETPLTNKNWTLPSGDGAKTVYYQVKDNAGLISVTYSDTITLDTTPPSGSITIAEGSAYTNATSVTLTLSAIDATSGVSQMQFSNDGITWMPWEAIATSKAWTLPPGDGTKTVYVQFKDWAGLVSLYSGTIILDTTSPTIIITSPGDGTEIRSSSPTIEWDGTDATSGIDHYEIRLDDGSWINVGKDAIYTFAGVGDGSHTVKIKAFDKVGYSQVASVNFTVNTSPIGGPGYTEEVALTAAIIVIAALGIVVYLLKIRKKA